MQNAVHKGSNRILIPQFQHSWCKVIPYQQCRFLSRNSGIAKGLRTSRSSTRNAGKSSDRFAGRGSAPSSRREDRGPRFQFQGRGRSRPASDSDLRQTRDTNREDRSSFSSRDAGRGSDRLRPDPLTVASARARESSYTSKRDGRRGEENTELHSLKKWHQSAKQTSRDRRVIDYHASGRDVDISAGRYRDDRPGTKQVSYGRRDRDVEERPRRSYGAQSDRAFDDGRTEDFSGRWGAREQGVREFDEDSGRGFSGARDRAPRLQSHDKRGRDDTAFSNRGRDAYEQRPQPSYTRERDTTFGGRHDARTRHSPRSNGFESNSFDNAQDEDLDHDLDTSIPGYTTAASTFLYGKRSVLAALKSRKRKPYNLYARESRSWDTMPEGREILKLATDNQVPIKRVSWNVLDRLAQKTSRQAGESIAPLHDGVCLEASPFPELPVKHLGALDDRQHRYELALEPQSREDAEINGTPSYLPYSHQGWRHPLLLWLHGTVDMRNVGAIMRTCLYFGVDVILSRRGTAGSGFLRTSAGASEYMDIVRVGNESAFITQSRAAGWKFYSAVAPTASSKDAPIKTLALDDLEISPLTEHPCVIVLGNEDLGLPPAFVRSTDFGISIGGRTRQSERAGVDSLNVSIAAALLVERFVRRPTGVEKEVAQTRRREKMF